MNVLLTNDDGIGSPGIAALYRALVDAGHRVWAVAPMTQQSGVSRALTVFSPLRAESFEMDGLSGMGIHGTPADCVKLGLGGIADAPVDLVLAGINAGPNSGPDIYYSGTVAAAAEGAQAGLPSMSISHDSHEPAADFGKMARHAVALAEKIDFASLGPGIVVNVNYPKNFPEKGGRLRVCPRSRAAWRNVYDRRYDPRGRPYWWLVGEVPAESIGTDTDRGLLASGHVTVTPLLFDFEAPEALEKLRALESGQP